MILSESVLYSTWSKLKRCKTDSDLMTDPSPSHSVSSTSTSKFKLPLAVTAGWGCEFEGLRGNMKNCVRLIGHGD